MGQMLKNLENASLAVQSVVQSNYEINYIHTVHIHANQRIYCDETEYADTEYANLAQSVVHFKYVLNTYTLSIYRLTEV